jgi:hypothetical protein
LTIRLAAWPTPTMAQLASAAVSHISGFFIVVLS